MAQGFIGLTAGEAHAYVVNVGGQNYDVTTFTGTYNGNISKFATAANGGVMPWWQNASLAQTFAQQVFDSLGTPNNFAFNGVQQQFGPLFGYLKTGTLENYRYQASINSVVLFNVQQSNFTVSRVWAQASLVPPPPVPGPLPALGAVAAFGFSRKLRKRIKINKGSSATFTLI